MQPQAVSHSSTLEYPWPTSCSDLSGGPGGAHSLAGMPELPRQHLFSCIQTYTLPSHLAWRTPPSTAALTRLALSEQHQQAPVLTSQQLHQWRSLELQQHLPRCAGSQHEPCVHKPQLILNNTVANSTACRTPKSTPPPTSAGPRCTRRLADEALLSHHFNAICHLPIRAT